MNKVNPKAQKVNNGNRLNPTELWNNADADTA